MLRYAKLVSSLLNHREFPLAKSSHPHLTISAHLSPSLPRFHPPASAPNRQSTFGSLAPRAQEERWHSRNSRRRRCFRGPLKNRRTSKNLGHRWTQMDTVRTQSEDDWSTGHCASAPRPALSTVFMEVCRAAKIANK